MNKVIINRENLNKDLLVNFASVLVLGMITLSLIQSAHAKKRIIYKYKKYEKFDLGNLSIKGKIIAPGDITVRQRKRKRFMRPLLRRTDFMDNILTELSMQR
jgi:hypothetical protein